METNEEEERVYLYLDEASPEQLASHHLQFISRLSLQLIWRFCQQSALKEVEEISADCLADYQAGCEACDLACKDAQHAQERVCNPTHHETLEWANTDPQVFQIKRALNPKASL